MVCPTRFELHWPLAHAAELAQVVHGFAWPREHTGSVVLSREQFDWLVAGLPWQRLGAPAPHAITAN